MRLNVKCEKVNILISEHCAELKMWIARDENYDLWLFTEKPDRQRNIIQGYWYSDIGETMRLDAHDPQFKDITWDNEPVKVELKLI